MDGQIIIAVDAMGGDNSPEKIIKGIELSLKDNNDNFFEIYGDKPKLDKLIKKQSDIFNFCKIVHCENSIDDNESPLTAAKKSNTTSMWKSIESQKKGQAHITLSAGNTGALLFLSRLILNTIEGISKPALAGLWPNKIGMNVVLDLGGLDILINNAGVACFTSFEERTEDELDYVIGVNLKGTIFMIQTVFKHFFKPQKRGCIINIGSIYGVVSGDMRLYAEGDRKTSEIYGASKAAVINLTKYFAAYMAPNVRVNCISPGGIFNYQDSDFVQMYSRKVPMERMGKEEELLSTLEYLISDESSYVTGQNIVVDGGLTAW